MLRIPRSSAAAPYTYSYYYLDYRRPFGVYFDTFSPGSAQANGVTVRVGPRYGDIIQTRLLDTTPGDGTFNNSPLAAAKTYTDPSSGMTIKTLSVTPGAATVQVSGMPGKVEVKGSELTYTSYPGVRNNVTVSLSGSTYTVADRGTAVLPPGAGCSGTADPQVVECDATGVTTERFSLGEDDDHFTNNAAPPRSSTAAPATTRWRAAPATTR